MPQEKVPLLARLQALCEDLPGVETGTSYGTPALKAGGKLFVRVKDAGTLVLMAPVDEKERLIEMAPGIYYETDHYRGWPALLVRAAAIDDAELRRRLAEAWHFKAPARPAQDARLKAPPVSRPTGPYA